MLAPLLDFYSSLEPEASVSLADLLHHLVKSHEVTDTFLGPLHDELFEGLLAI